MAGAMDDFLRASLMFPLGDGPHNLEGQRPGSIGLQGVA